MASARTVAVVVPSPATSLVLLAASLTSCAPIFSKGSFNSISSATVTPSLVTLGLPQPLSSTALRPRGPRVERTARASLLTPARSFCRASSLYASCFAPIHISFHLVRLQPHPAPRSGMRCSLVRPVPTTGNLPRDAHSV